MLTCGFESMPGVADLPEEIREKSSKMRNEINRYLQELMIGSPGNVVSNNLSDVSKVGFSCTRVALRLEYTGQLRLRQPFRSHGQNQLHHFLFFKGWLPIIDQQERDGGVCADSFIAIDEWMVLAEMKQIGRSQSRNGGVK